MNFYGRSAELVQLQKLSQRAYSGYGTMTLMVGRRRVGKTYLIKECYQHDLNFLYFFVSRKSQELLCEEYLKIISARFSIPIFSEQNSRNIKYFIKDNFLNFWFRYFNKNQSAVEIGNFAYIIELIKEDFLTYSGIYLEKMVRELLAASGNYNIIGNYWEKDSSNEIGVIACNESKKIMLIADVKLQSKKINLELLKHKAAKIIAQRQGYDIEFAGFSLGNIVDLVV